MMLVLLLCVIMKIAEYSVGRASPTLPVPARPLLAPCCNKRKRHDRHFYRKPNDTLKYIQQKRAGKGVAVMDDPQTPGSDCNSNPASDSITQDLINSEFVQDNVEYQWFIDYGYRDGGLHVHPSVLSSLSASYTRDDLGYYDDLSRNLDVNLAEVDMESFRTADIHTLLTALPVMCTDPIQHSEGEDSACSTTDTISICKSSLLFSPLKETPVLPPGGSYSVDSLDCEDMLLTCQANNKNNYTIAFEGSITMYSDGSQDFDTQDKQQKAYEAPEPYCTEKIDLKNILDLSMACSDSKIYTTWSNLKHSATNKIMSRHPSGNNNTIPNFLQGPTLMFNTNKRSQSLPDLTKTRQLQQVNVPLNFSVDSAESNNQPANLESSTSAMSRSVNEESSSSVGNPSNGGKKLQNLSLVRLFMKQKSMSAEGMSLTLDQSDSASDSGWPTSNSDSGTNTNTNTQIQRKNLNRTENDFSINWVKPDYYLTETQTTAKKSIKEESEHKEETLTSSVSIEELSESQMSKSDLQKEFHVLHNSIDNRRFNLWSSPLEAGVCQSRTTTGVQAKTEVEDNQVQTSLIYPPDKVFPSWKETCIDKKPIYVVYPNYALPDLSFLNSKEVEMRNVSLKPQSFENKEKSNLGNAAKGAKNGRPFSCNDLDALKQRGFSHVEDWESLTFLLPLEYKKVLHDVPELSKHINLNEMKKPLFCLSPPMKHRRPVSGEINNRTSTSSTSSSATPSSGYRGSSTMLSDSSTNRSQTNPLYLYRYDSVSSEASLMGQKKPVNQRTNVTRIPSLPKRSISLPHGTDKEGAGDFHNVKVPPRPPLPRSILRKNRTPSKRYSMFEMGMGNVEEVTDQLTEKRKSLQEPYYINNDLHLLKNGRIVDSEKDIDEVEERLKETEKARYESDVLESSEDDMRQLEEFLKRSGFSSQSSDDNDDPDIKLRSYVRKFLALKMNKDLIKNVEMIDSQKKTVSFAVNQRRKYLDNKISNFNVTPCNQNKETVITEDAIENNSDVKESSLEDKKKMMASINQAVELLLKYWHTEPNRNRLSNSEKNECAQLCLSNLCPAIYALMSNGLRPHLNSTFGPIANNVWKVVEASSQQGPLTKTLNELVQKINGEDFMTEGMLKFHAFVFGLLNLRALDAWFAYLCTRESILRKHYTSNSLFVAALSSVNARKTVDGFLDILQPLAFCPFQIDLLYQYRQLHNSFGNLTTNALMSPTFKTPDLCGTEHVEHRTTTSPSKMRPRSCGYNYEDLQKPHLELNNAKKRLSTPPLNSKLFHALERFTSEDSEEYTDSLEHSPLNRATPKKANQNLGADDETQTAGEAKFRKLQEKWELMGKEEREHQQSCLDSPPSPVKTPSSAGKSKIPRLLTSPVKQPNSSAKGSKNSPVTGIPSLKKPAMLPAKTPPKKPGDLRQKEIPRRTSRVDQDNVGTARPHLTRPSSLPYKTQGIVAKDKSLVSPHRRAASTSLPRSTATAAKHSAVKQPLKVVRTLSHRLPSDNGHLAFNEGEKLKVILEVDAKWLLCAKGDRKGLVPRACVHAVQT